MKAPPELKKRKLDGAGENFLRSTFVQRDDTQAAKTIRDRGMVPMAQTSSMSLEIQQAKNFAVSQAQQECCTGNFRIFDSPFGNFLVPVIPTREELRK